MVMDKNNHDHWPDGKCYAVNVNASYGNQSEIRNIIIQCIKKIKSLVNLRL